MEDIHVTGTLIWYYYICQREVWLMAHQITGDQQNDEMDLGRFIHENSYKRLKKEVLIDYLKIDLLRRGDEGFVIGEIKKSATFLQSAKMQLLYYLYELEQRGMRVTGEIKVPIEKKVYPITLTKENREEIMEAKMEILKIIYAEHPMPPKKIVYCRRCAYREFCWI